MKRAILLIGATLAVAGCGSQAGAGSTHTVVKTRTVTTQAPVPQECIEGMDKMRLALQHMGKAAKIFVNQILPAYDAGTYGQPLDVVSANIRRGTAQIKQSTSFVDEATALVVTCGG